MADKKSIKRRDFLKLSSTAVVAGLTGRLKSGEAAPCKVGL
jgi:hypothetical protein